MPGAGLAPTRLPNLAFFKSNISPPKECTLFEGDDSLKGFFRVLKAALDEKKYDISCLGAYKANLPVCF